MDESTKENKTAEEWCRMGESLAAQGKYREALAAFNAAIEQKKHLADAYFGRGTCEYGLGRYDRARESFRAATVMGSRVAQMWSKLELTTDSDLNDDDDET